MTTMAGTWIIRWADGKYDQYTITSEGAEGDIAIKGIDDLFHLSPSTTSTFAASEGWYSFSYMRRYYYLRVVDGKMYLHYYGDEEECPTTFRSLSGYCRDGRGITVAGLCLYLDLFIGNLYILAKCPAGFHPGKK